MEANYIDLPTILIYLFWIGFALLIIHLRREDKRVGYPLESDRKGVTVQGYPAMPAPRPERAKHPALEGGATAFSAAAAPAAASPPPAPSHDHGHDDGHDHGGHDHSDEEPNR